MRCYLTICLIISNLGKLFNIDFAISTENNILLLVHCFDIYELTYFVNPETKGKRWYTENEVGVPY